MHIIEVTVRDRVATHIGDDFYVCGNTEYEIHFDFDEEWDALDIKTARFIADGNVLYPDRIFSGNVCSFPDNPPISNTTSVRVGVFAGNLHTTTPARIPAAKSILCGTPTPAAPDEDAYHEAMAEMSKVATDARAQAEASAKSAEASAQSATEAAASAQAAAASESTVGQYSANADAQAKAAAASAQAAAASELEAAKSKDKAIAQADDAEEYAKGAAASATAAAASAANAADSATSSHQSFRSASGAAGNAQQYANSGAASAAAAETAKQTAQDMANAAAQSATSAMQSNSSANDAASKAAASAANADTSAKAAAASERTAGQHSANADAKAKAAEGSAQAADKSASDAAASADAAAKSAAAILDTSAPLQQLVTDLDGAVKWEERLAYKINRMERTTYLPSGEWTYSDEGYAVGTSEWAATVQAGVDYVVEYNGAPYTCKAASDGTVIVLGGNGYPFELIYNPPSLPMIFPTDGSMPSSVEVYKDEVVEHKKTIDPELLPEGIGGGAGLPETADPLKQLVTDADGNVAWEDRLAYKYTTTGEVVNLEETALMGGDEDGDGTADGFYLVTPWAVDIEAGKTYNVNFNGTTCECKAIDGRTVEPETAAGMLYMGNLAAFGAEGIEGSNPDAPFVLVAVDNGTAESDMNGMYGMFIPLNGATSATLSVTHTGKTETIKTIAPEFLPPVESVFNVRTTATVYHTTTGFDFSAFDKTYAEMAAAYKAGSHVRIVCTMYNNGAKMGDLIGEVVTTINANMDMTEERENPTLGIRMPMGILVANTNVRFWLGEGENGEIVSKPMSA